jgi:hypothetical protein
VFCWSRTTGGPYSGPAQAAIAARIVAKDYQRWSRTPAAVLAATDNALRKQAANFQQVWAQIAQHGLTDGPGPAVTRYQAVAACARALADDPTFRLPSAALTPLLELAIHADKHAICLDATAVAGTCGPTGSSAEHGRASAGPPARAGTAEQLSLYQGLPAQIAAAVERGHSGTPHHGQASPPARNRLAAHDARQRAGQHDTAR